jgi:HEAT repeat protein
MGPRATLAGPALVDALGDPGLAPDAALALGSVAYPSAEPVLRRLLSDPGTDHGLRVACATSLGRIGLSASAPALQAQLGADAPADLRLAAARSLCELGLGASGAAATLRDALSDPRADRFGAELALEGWLRTLEGAEAEALLEDWSALAPDSGSISTPAEDRARLEARAALLASRWDQLKGL